MTSEHETYVTFVRSLEGVNERETLTQLVYAVSDRNFCWVSKSVDLIQLFPPLGKKASPTRMLRREGTLVLCQDCRSGKTDASYEDPDGVLAQAWSYPGFRRGQCSPEYGFSLIRQAYDQVRTVPEAIKAPLAHRSGGGETTSRQPQSTVSPAIDEMKSRVERMRDQIVQMGRTVSAPIIKEDQAAMIARLEREGVLPSNVASMIHLIRTARNRIKYDHHVPSAAEWLAIESAWLVVEDWWLRNTGTSHS